MVKMKTLACTSMLVGLMGLSACSGTDAQVNYAKGIMAAQTTYNTLAAPMPDVMMGKMPGVPALTDNQKELIKASSKAVRTLLDNDVFVRDDGAYKIVAVLPEFFTFFAIEPCSDLKLYASELPCNSFNHKAAKRISCNTPILRHGANCAAMLV